MMIAYIFGAYEEASNFLSAFNQICRMPPTFQLVHMHFFRGMICLALAARGKDRRKNLRVAKRMLHKMKTWATKSPHNCLEKRFLLEAEMLSTRGQPEKAYEKYTCAIALAKDAGFLYMHSLASERCGRHLYALGQKESARPFFEEACQVLDEWGGTAKRLHLQEEMESMFPPCNLCITSEHLVRMPATNNSLVAV
jgi:tetratricopeptide (TPR) repeat protein